MAKVGRKPKENALSVRVQFRISPDTMAAFEDCAEVLDVPPHQLMRQALDESAGFMVTMSAALRQMKGEDPIKGLDLYRQILSSFGPQIEVQQGVIDSWDERIREHQQTQAETSSETEEKSGTE